MRKDYQIAIVLALSAIPAGTALMAAPEYLGGILKEYAGLFFWAGAGLTLLLFLAAIMIAARSEASESRRGSKRRMIALVGMTVSGLSFVGFSVAYFWPSPVGRTEGAASGSGAEKQSATPPSSLSALAPTLPSPPPPPLDVRIIPSQGFPQPPTDYRTPRGKEELADGLAELRSNLTKFQTILKERTDRVAGAFYAMAAPRAPASGERHVYTFSPKGFSDMTQALQDLLRLLIEHKEPSTFAAFLHSPNYGREFGYLMLSEEYAAARKEIQEKVAALLSINKAAKAMHDENPDGRAAAIHFDATRPWRHLPHGALPAFDRWVSDVNARVDALQKTLQ